MNTVLQFMMETYVTIASTPGQFILLSWYHIILCVFTLLIEQGFLQNRMRRAASSPSISGMRIWGV